MKLVFLDIDGVLNPVRWMRTLEHRAKGWRHQLYCKVSRFEQKYLRADEYTRGALTKLLHPWLMEHNAWEPQCCKNLNHLLAAYPDLRIVVSSSWRMRGLDLFKRIAERNGIDPKLIIGSTPRYQGEHRGFEIWHWLDEHQGAVDAFVILDDETDMPPFMDRLMKTDGYQGFTLWDVQRTAKILDKPWDGLLGLPVHRERDR